MTRSLVVAPIVVALAVVVFGHQETGSARVQGGGASPLGVQTPAPVTKSVAVESSPSLSPDGQSVAYTSNEAGNADIWVARIGGGAAENRTGDHRQADNSPRWSPRGAQIAFWSAREGGGIFVMPASGGPARKLAPTEYAAPAAWSPDGSEIAYSRSTGGVRFIEIQHVSTGATRRVTLADRPGNQRLDPAWSPDGRFIAYVHARNYTAQATELWLLRLQDGKSIPIGDGRMMEWSPVWAPDSRSLYVSSNRGGAVDLWQQGIDNDGAASGAPVRVTTNLGASGISLSPDGSSLAYSNARRISNVWSVPVRSDRQTTWADARQVTQDQSHIEFLALSPDGTRLMVSSDRAGNPDLWVMPVAGGAMQQVTSTPTPEWSPSWSPDGRDVAFYALASGNREIWRQPVTGGAPRQLTRGDVESVNPHWSPDGRTIVYGSPRAGTQDIWRVPANGGDAIRLTSDEWSDANPVWSPDGKWVAFTSSGPEGSRIRRVPSAGGPVEVVTKGQGSMPMWAPNGQLFFVSGRSGSPNIWTIAADGQTERQVTDLSGKRGVFETNGFAAAANSLLIVWREDVGDIWVANVLKRK